MGSLAIVWGCSHIIGLGHNSPATNEANMLAHKNLFKKLPHACKILDHKVASPLVTSSKELNLSSHDQSMLKSVASSAFTSDVNVKGDRVVHIQP